MFKHHTLQMYEEVEVQLHEFLTAALDGGDLSIQCSSCFTSGERVPVPVL
jgi:hypothetical protein